MWSSRRKSCSTMPIRLRRSAISSLASSETSWPNRLTRPRVGRSDRNSSLNSEVLPAPDGPVRNWKEWAGIRKERSRKIYELGPESLCDLSFLIPAHSFPFLPGPSGAGKTSLLRLLFLSLRPTRGLVNLFGQDVSLLAKDEIADLRKRIGIVLQDFRLLDHMTTYENVALPFRVMGREESSYRREVIDLLRWVGLGERMDALPPILSGGEKQRAAIARAVISRPQLLLADEPTGSVDPTLGRRLLRLFIELNRLGTAVIIATHDITLMDQYEARRMVLHQGR